MIFNELITTCPLSNHIKIITNFVKLGCRTALRRRCPPPLEMTRQICRVPVFGYHCGNESSFFQSCSISMKTTWNCLFIDTNIDIYVPFGKSVYDVTFRLCLRHLFVRGWKKLWSITLLALSWRQISHISLWFLSKGLYRAVRNWKQAKLSNEKISLTRNKNRNLSLHHSAQTLTQSWHLIKPTHLTHHRPLQFLYWPEKKPSVWPQKSFIIIHFYYLIRLMRYRSA